MASAPPPLPPPGAGGDDKEDKQQGKQQSIPETDTEDLKRFREKWKRELQVPDPTSTPSSTLQHPDSQHNAFITLPSSLSSLSLDQIKQNVAYSRGSIGENPLITRFLALLEEDEQEEEGDGAGDQPPSHPPISVLPAELQLAIFINLDVKSLEHCSVVCRFWYILARDEGLPQFQSLCLGTWAGITTSIFESYQCDWRTMYLHRPRLRDDGIYISRNYYLRAGATEGTYYQPVHEVVYFRYLRFLAHGTVIYAMSSDVPKQALNWFKPSASNTSHSSLRAVHSGSYVLDGDVVQVWVKISPTHTSCLDLKVESSLVGRNDRLALVEYKCVYNDNDVERIEVEIKKFRFVKLPKQYLQDAQVNHSDDV